MHRLILFLLVGVVLNTVTGLGGPDSRKEPEFDGVMFSLARPLIPQIPQIPQTPQAPQTPHTIYLPFVMNRYSAYYISPFGVVMYGDISQPAGLGKMQAAGSGSVTTYFQWSDVEPAEPVSGTHTYVWTSFDAKVASARAAGMNVFVLFSGNPSWAAQLRGGPVYPEHVADLVSMTAAAAERYDGDGYNDAPGNPVVKSWSFYAEPDNGDLGTSQASDKGYWGNNPTGYANMLAGVSTAMHAANPKAAVLIGGLAYDIFYPDGPYVKTFLDRTLVALNALAAGNHDPRGAAAYIDAVAFHYYPISFYEWPTIRDKALEIRSIMAPRGVGNLPLIVPEMGYWSDAVPPPDDQLNSTEDMQARGLVRMFVVGIATGIQQLSWFTVFDDGPSTEAHGLFRGTDLNNPKPSYVAYTTLTQELGGATYTGAMSSPGAEGYIFKTWNEQKKTVVWATQASANVVFHQSCLRRVDYLGNVASPIYDGNPGWDWDSVAGQITLQVFKEQPIYVGEC